jgi:5'(3')-deoxyribonucleotidase
MLTENLTEYMQKVHITNKDVSEYINEENGTRYIIPTGHLLAKVDYLELTEKELEQAKYKLLIDKHTDYKTTISTRPVLKSDLTGKEKDKDTIVDSTVKVYQVWNVSNGLNIKQSFDNKEEAVKLYEEIKEKVIKYYE